MNQIAHIELETISWTGEPADQAGMAVRRVLVSAWQDVHAGDLHAARRRCAEAVTSFQPRLADNPDLLADMITVLATVRAFRAIERLVQACQGRPIRIELVPAHAPRPRTWMAGETEHHLISEGCLADAWTVRQWSEQLLREPAAAGLPGAALIPSAATP